jgi:hypothetical protein
MFKTERVYVNPNYSCDCCGPDFIICDVCGRYSDGDYFIGNKDYCYNCRYKFKWLPVKRNQSSKR